MHTKGPWETREIPALHVIAIAPVGKMMPIASVARWIDASDGPLRITDEDRANANLIEAAPDLLAACRLALHMIEDEQDETIAVLEAAITKATRP